MKRIPLGVWGFWRHILHLPECSPLLETWYRNVIIMPRNGEKNPMNICHAKIKEHNIYKNQRNNRTRETGSEDISNVILNKRETLIWDY